MNKLKNYQSLFVNEVIHNDQNPNAELLDQMIPIGNLSAKAVVGVYANDYRYRMLEAMQTNFETVWMVLGDEKFESLILEFIKCHTSSESDLNLYGNKFPEFLSQNSELIEEMPFLVDLAKFEIAFWKMFHRPKPNNVDRNNFNQERIFASYLLFDGSLQLFESEYNVFPLFQYKDKTLNDFFEENDPALINESAYYILFKNENQVSCQRLTAAQNAFLLQLKEPKTLLEVINLGPDISEAEMMELFQLITSSLLHQLKTSLATR